MQRKSYKGLDKDGNIVRWHADINSKEAFRLWKKDPNVMRITEDGKEIWKR